MLRFPKVLPSPWYRDPGESVMVSAADVVVCGVALLPLATVEPPRDIAATCRPVRARRDRYYTMARRVRVRQAMATRRGR